MTDSVSKSAVPELLLASHLKTLRLPTSLREYDKLARQCAVQGLGLAACQKGLTVRFITASSLVNELMETRDEKRLLRF